MPGIAGLVFRGKSALAASSDDRFRAHQLYIVAEPKFVLALPVLDAAHYLRLQCLTKLNDRLTESFRHPQRQGSETL